MLAIYSGARSGSRRALPVHFLCVGNGSGMFGYIQ